MDKETLELIKNNDQDRYLISLIAGKKPYALMAVLALDCELSKIVAHHSDTMLAQIKLTWWREALEEAYTDPSKTRQHPSLQFFKEHLIDKHHHEKLNSEAFDPLIDGRITLVEDASAIIDYARETAGTLFKIWQLIETPESEEDALSYAEHVGLKWGILRTIKAIQFQCLQQQGKLDPQALVSLGIPEKDLFSGEGDIEANMDRFVTSLVESYADVSLKTPKTLAKPIKLADYHCDKKLALLKDNQNSLIKTNFDQSSFKTLMGLWWANLTKV